MKIVHVVPAYFPSYIWGGVPYVVRSLALELQKRGHDVSVFTHNVLEFDRNMRDHSFEGEQDGIRVMYLNAIWQGRKPNSVGFLWSPDVLKYRHCISDADMVHIHGNRHFLFLMSGIIAQITDTPYVIHPQGSLRKTLGRSWLKRIYDPTIGRLIYSQAGAAIAQNNEEIDLLQSIGVAENRVFTLPNAIDLESIPDEPPQQSFRQTFGIPQEMPLLLFLARLHYKKGADLLVEAMQNLDGVYLAIVGQDDGEQAHIEALIAKHNLSGRVQLTGPIFDVNMKYAAYREADIMILPTRGPEGMPTTLLEAAAVGTPIVVTDRTEISRMIHEQVGIEVKCDIASLARGIRELLAHDALRVQYAQAGPSFVDKHFRIQSVVDKLLGIYEIART